MAFRGPFWLQGFYDSMILRYQLPLLGCCQHAWSLLHGNAIQAHAAVTVRSSNTIKSRNKEVVGNGKINPIALQLFFIQWKQNTIRWNTLNIPTQISEHLPGAREFMPADETGRLHFLNLIRKLNLKLSSSREIFTPPNMFSKIEHEAERKSLNYLLWFSNGLGL